mgnify:CR=1 FL=1
MALGVCANVKGELLTHLTDGQVILCSHLRISFSGINIQYRKFQRNLTAYHRVLFCCEGSVVMGLQAKFRMVCPRLLWPFLSHLPLPYPRPSPSLCTN